MSRFDTSCVTNMANMFLHCNGLTSIDMSRFDMSQATTMSGMIAGCTSLTEIAIPRNVQTDADIRLPSGTWRDASGNIYTKLPVGQTESFIITKVSE